MLIRKQCIADEGICVTHRPVRGRSIRNQTSAATRPGKRNSPAKAFARLSVAAGILLFRTSTAVNACPRSNSRWHSSCAAVTRAAPLFLGSPLLAIRALDVLISTAGPCLGPHTASPSKLGGSTGRVCKSMPTSMISLKTSTRCAEPSPIYWRTNAAAAWPCSNGLC